MSTEQHNGTVIRSTDSARLTSFSDSGSILQLVMDSSVIQSFFYHAEGSTLDIVFKNGSSYRYDNVPVGMVYSLIGAGSTGAFFNKFIRNAFAFEQVSGRVATA